MWSRPILSAEPPAGPAEQPAGPVLRAEAVTAGYGGDPVVRDVSVRTAPGEVVSVVGPNGSGKSTLLKALVGVIHVSSGRVLLGETEITNLQPEDVARAGIGYVPQVDDVFAPLTVRENLEMGGYLLGRRTIPARIDPVLSPFPRLATMPGRPALVDAVVGGGGDRSVRAGEAWAGRACQVDGGDRLSIYCLACQILLRRPPPASR